MSGRKRSSCFAVTINHVEWGKDALGVFLEATEDIKRLAIGQEIHHPPLDCITGEVVNDNGGFHHHIFVEFKEKYFLSEVRNIFEEFLGGEPHSIDIQVGMQLIISFIMYYQLYFLRLVLQISKVLDFVPHQRGRSTLLVRCSNL